MGKTGASPIIGQTQPNVVHFLVLVPRFVFTGNTRRQAQAYAPEKENFRSLCLCLRRGNFHSEIRAIVIAFVLALVSLVKTRFNSQYIK